MGIAAYNRGSEAIRKDLDRQQSAPEMIMLRDWTEHSARFNGRKIFRPTVIRLDRQGNAFLMNRPDRGWRESAYQYSSVWKIAEHWHLTFLEFGEDEHSRYIWVI